MLPLPLDHIGIAVSDLDQELLRYERDFGGCAFGREKVEDQHVEVVFVKLCSNTLVELLCPLQAGGPIQKFLATHGPGLHHLCFSTLDIHAELERLQQAGYQVIDQVPRRGAHNSLIAFLHPKSCGGVLLELRQRAA
jgi:methylmalonyl-CoA/ethylmalonyl-CoA epimerase